MKLVNICFHGIGTPQRELEPGEDRYWITADSYLRILDEVAGRTDVRLSFDDGNASDLELGLPGLLDRGLSAAFFPIAGRMGAAGSLSATDVRTLAKNGMTIGTHGMRHRPWRGLTAGERAAELVEARRELAEAAGAPVTEAALPLGRYDRTVLGELRRLGYARVYSSDRRKTRPGAWLQPRFSVTREDDAASVRAMVLTEPAAPQRIKLAGVGLVKRLR